MKKAVLLFACALFGAFYALLDFAPATPPAARPAAVDVQASIELINRIDAERNRGALYRWDAIHSAAKLAAQTFGVSRLRIVAPTIQGEPARAEISRAIGMGIWVNASLSLKDGKEFPPVEVQIGKVRFPAFLSRWMVEFGLNQARRSHPFVPALDTMLRHVTILPDGVRAHLDLPMAMLSLGRGGGLTASTLAQTRVCTVVQSFENGKPIALAALLNRIFSTSLAAPADGREMLAALSMQASPTETSRFLPARPKPRTACLPAAPVITLHGRTDLAQHWLLSAALAANFGPAFTDQLGFWKELSDSAPLGSGFSFVDLAADCSGQRWGARLSGTTADIAERELHHITEASLLPAETLELDEGLSEAEFSRRFGSMDTMHCMRKRYEKRS